MAVKIYRWPARNEFRDRAKEMTQLEDWWADTSREPLNLYGRRRVGKSWLFRYFAHGKKAVILVADRGVTGQQLTHMADQLTTALGFRPQLDDVADLFSVIYDLAAGSKTLVVIDEFPYLLGTTIAERQRTLSAVQAVMERKRESSKLKLVLTGSTIAQMEELQSEKNPLHGRLVPLDVWPMTYAPATLLLEGEDPVEKLIRYSIAGGMPRYLAAFGRGNLTDTIVRVVADPGSQLFNEPRTLLSTELREPTVYFSILEELAENPKSVADIADALRVAANELSSYLNTLSSLRLAERRRPVGAGPQSRISQWKCTDHFVRFWFRFIRPYQAELEAGADPAAHVAANITPYLNEHASWAFEEAVTAWVRRRHAGSTAVGGWWGNSVNHLRASKQRSAEEIDTVALRGKKVVAVAEAKWTNKPLGQSVLSDLLNYKLPALAQAGFEVAGAEIVLASRAGFTDGVIELAQVTSNTHLVTAADLLTDL